MVILALGLRTARAISTHADRCLSVAWRAPSRRLPLSGIGPANDIPIARRRVARRQAEQFFERRMPVKAAIVAKDKFLEICIDEFVFRYNRRLHRHASFEKLLGLTAIV